MGHVGQYVRFRDASGQFVSRDSVLAAVLKEFGMPIHKLGQGFRQHEQPSIHKTLQQDLARGIHERRKHEESCHQDDGGPADQAAQGFHVETSGSSSIYPAPRTVAIKGGEKSRSILARRARMWASTIFVMGS